jgi:hypothetical protein
MITMKCAGMLGRREMHEGGDVCCSTRVVSYSSTHTHTHTHTKKVLRRQVFVVTEIKFVK